MVEEAGVNLRLHSWYAAPIMEGNAVAGVICQTKTGLQAVRARTVVDASGDADVAYTAGAPFMEGAYMVTTVFRLGQRGYRNRGKPRNGSRSSSPSRATR